MSSVSDLFSMEPSPPLAEALRALALAFQSGKLHSMILWGPPGVGKTALSALFSGVKDILAAMEEAERNLQQGKRTLLFVDEIHRYSKAVKWYISQRIINHVARLCVLPHCSMGVRHG